MFPAFLTVCKKKSSALRPLTNEEIFDLFRWRMSNDVICRYSPLFEFHFDKSDPELIDVMRVAQSLQKMRRIWTVISVLLCSGESQAVNEVALMTRHSVATIEAYYDMFAHQRLTVRASENRGAMFGMQDDYRESNLEESIKPMVLKLNEKMYPPLGDTALHALRKQVAASMGAALSLENPKPKLLKN